MTDAVLTETVQIARQAGELLLRHYNRSGTSARLKADRSVVTEADLAADHLITAAIQSRYPGEAVLSEELNPTLGGEVGEVVWVIDPLDGTTNFSLGLPIWGISIARLVGGQPDSGVLYFPLLDELYTASRNHGANFNEQPMRAEPPDPDIPSTFFSCCSRTFQNYQVEIKYKPRILGSAAYSFCSVARGIALIAFEATPKIWDLAAVWLLVTEAGGVVETYDGANPFPLLPGADYGRTSFPTLAAATPELMAKARRKIIAKKANQDIG